MRRINIQNPKKLIHKSIGKMWYESESNWGYSYHIVKNFGMFSIVSVEMIIQKDTIEIEGKEFVKFHYHSKVGEIIQKFVKIEEFKKLDKVIKEIIKSIEEFD
jgi:hypothetical protein